MISSANILFEFICFVMALCFLKGNDKFTLFTKLYLGFVCITETSGFLWKMSTNKSNIWIFNIYILFEALYISFGLYHFIKPFKKNVKPLYIATYLIFIAVYLYGLFTRGFFKFQTTAIMVASVLIVFLCLYYYHNLMKSDKIISIRNNLGFWWVAAVLFFYFGSTVYNLFMNVIFSNKPFAYEILVYIMLTLNAILYGIWSYSFICSSRHQKLLTSSY